MYRPKSKAQSWLILVSNSLVDRKLLHFMSDFRLFFQFLHPLHTNIPIICAKLILISPHHISKHSLMFFNHFKSSIVVSLKLVLKRHFVTVFKSEFSMQIPSCESSYEPYALLNVSNN